MCCCIPLIYKWSSKNTMSGFFGGGGFVLQARAHWRGRLDEHSFEEIWTRANNCEFDPDVSWPLLKEWIMALCCCCA